MNLKNAQKSLINMMVPFSLFRRLYEPAALQVLHIAPRHALGALTSFPSVSRQRRPA